MADELDIEVHAVTPDRWRDLVDLFERPGPRGGTPPPAWCWCMWWRDRSDDGVKNEAAMERIVGEGREPGLLAYVGGVPVGWVAVAPREEHAQLVRSPTFKPPDPAQPGVFAVTCFFVHPSARRRGVARRLVLAAVEHARSRGARAVEAYAAEVRAGTSSQDFMGVKDWFLAAGFEPIRKVRSKTVVRLDLASPVTAGG